MPQRRKGGDLQDVANTAYDASAAFGSFMALINAIGGTILAILVICIGIMIVSKKDPYQGRTTAKITAANCGAQSSCIIDYEYTVDGKKYTIAGYTAPGMYAIGSTKTILYDKGNAQNNKFDPPKWSMIGWIVIIVGIVILIGVWVWFFIVRTFKVAAAASGVGAIVDIADGDN